MRLRALMAFTALTVGCGSSDPVPAPSHDNSVVDLMTLPAGVYHVAGEGTGTDVEVLIVVPETTDGETTEYGMILTRGRIGGDLTDSAVYSYEYDVENGILHLSDEDGNEFDRNIEPTTGPSDFFALSSHDGTVDYSIQRTLKEATRWRNPEASGEEPNGTLADLTLFPDELGTGGYYYAHVGTSSGSSALIAGSYTLAGTDPFSETLTLEGMDIDDAPEPFPYVYQLIHAADGGPTFFSYELSTGFQGSFTMNSI
jgi:hypothetical protein